MSNNVYTPTTAIEDLYGEGDWRQILGEGPRKTGYKTYIIGKASIDERMEGVILPSFDWSMNLDDEDFFKRTTSCWTDKADQQNPRHFLPSAFAIPMFIYPYLGEKKEHWMSPSNKTRMIGGDTIDPLECADAFDDLGRYIRKIYKNDERTRDSFLKGKTYKDDPKVPGRRALFFSLAWVKDKDNPYHLAVIGYTPGAYNHIITQMRWYTPHGEAPLDPRWPQYLLGDPTGGTANRDEEGRIIEGDVIARPWHVDKVQLNPSESRETNVIRFTDRPEYIDPRSQPVTVPRQIIESRFRLPDPDNWCFPTYEEQVDYMMANLDPDVTADMIRAACGAIYKGEIPSTRPEQIRVQSDKSSESNGSAAPTTREHHDHDVDPLAAVQGRSSGSGFAPNMTAPPQPEPAAAAKQPPSQPEKEQAKSFWVGRAGVESKMMTQADIQDLVDSGDYEDYQVLVDGQSDWKTIEASGLAVIRKTPPAAPTPPTAPTAPAAPTAPTAPTAPAAPASTAPTQPAPQQAETQPATPSGGKTLEEFTRNLISGIDDLPDYKKAAAEDIAKRAYEATNRGVDRLPSDILAEVLEVITGDK